MRYITMAFIGLFFAMLIPLAQINAQSALLEIQQGGSGSLTGQELSQYAQIQQNSWVQTQWLVKVNPIEQFLNGNILSLKLPETEQTLLFTADFVSAPDANHYTWKGYNADGSTFSISKHSGGYMGSLLVASTGFRYGIINLSSGRTVLVKQTDASQGLVEDCDTEALDDESPVDERELTTGCEGNLIRVLFLYTNNATTTGLVPQTVAQNIINELNASCIASGLPATNISFSLANVLLLSGFTETNSMKHDLNDLCENNTAINLRNANYADIVVLLVDGLDPKAAGRAKSIGASSDHAFAIADISAAALGFTATHEVGHLIGARHQRCSVCFKMGCDPLPVYNHGFPIGEKFNTIMYQNGCSTNRSRIGRWSNPDAPFVGDATGDENNNNAKKLKNRAGEVSCFREAPPGGNQGTVITVSISGPSTICNNAASALYIPLFNPNVPPTNASYVWEVSPNGISNWTTVSNWNVCPLVNISALPNFFMLRVTITVGGNPFGVASMAIFKSPCLTDGAGDDRSNTQEKSVATIRLYPNPVTDVMQLTGIHGCNTMTIKSLDGRELRSIATDNLWMENQTIDCSGLLPGIYWLSVKCGEIVEEIKFVKF